MSSRDKYTDSFVEKNQTQDHLSLKNFQETKMIKKEEQYPYTWEKQKEREAGEDVEEKLLLSVHDMIYG